MSITKAQKLKDARETACHEVGHALVALHYEAKAARVIMIMTKGHKKPDFPAGHKCVHGQNIADNLVVSPMDIAAIGYAGVIGMLLYGDREADLDLTPDNTWEMVNRSPGDWSAEDLAHIERVTPDRKREAFDRAYQVIEANYDSLCRYTDCIAEDFSSLDSEKVEYLLTSIPFVRPARNILTCDDWCQVDAFQDMENK